MVSVPVRTWLTIFTRLSFMSCMACMRWPVSSCECTSMRCVRSPAATLSAILTASFKGRVMARISQKPISAASNTPASMITIEMVRTVT